jgi:hypothetical protein
MFATMFMCCALYAGAAQAQPYGFTDYQRELVGDWIVSSNGGCPSGSRPVSTVRRTLGNSLRCIMASGSGMVVYAPGQFIPDTVLYTPVPLHIAAQLPEPKMGEVYIVVDNNLYLITPGTRAVVASLVVMKPD